ncbi:hypothetical protein O3M35_007260 [Rhynocoris fuscipes]|uniref:Lipase domain-containing protein n=1 Tax=Rhynocoris fuscipes TaxID=488301 RepID=A0AAW1DA53_9HEMI
MRAICVLFIFILVHYSLASCINESASEYLSWHPKLEQNNSPTSAEYFSFDIQNNNNFNSFAIDLENTLHSEYLLETIVNKTAFYLYSEQNRDNPQKLQINNIDSIRNSNFDPAKFTRIIIHGFEASYKADYIQLMKDTLLDSNNDNIVIFDWSEIANLLYPSAASLTEKVGTVCGTLIDMLCNLKNGDTSMFHLIGHSLGAHVAGFAGKHVAVGKIARISGLDPALPGFTEGKDGRLDASDAVFVDCIHTCSGLLGLEGPFCHADFYPNGGSNPQPGCGDYAVAAKCSHERSRLLFIESIMEGHEFPALTCTDIPKSDSTECKFRGAYMGFPAKSAYQGIFYAETNAKEPYAPVVKDKTTRPHDLIQDVQSYMNFSSNYAEVPPFQWSTDVW